MKLLIVWTLLASQITLAQLPHGAATQSELMRNLPSESRLDELQFSRPFQLSGQAEKKSIGLAALYSLVLPGIGELYVGEYGTGKYFTIAEGFLWVTLGSVHWYATWLRDDARRFATQHAGITTGGKEDRYFVDIGNFDNVYDYNEEVLRGRDEFKVYDPNSSFSWNWDSGLNRDHYRELRVSSEERFNDTRFVAAAIGVNHVLSAINAARLAFLHNKNSGESTLPDVHASVIGGFAHPQGIMLSFTKQF